MSGHWKLQFVFSSQHYCY